MATFNKAAVKAINDFALEGQMKEMISEKNYPAFLGILSDILNLNDTKDLGGLIASVCSLMDIPTYVTLREALDSPALQETVVANTFSDPDFKLGED